MRAVLERFPGAEIVSVRNPNEAVEAIAAPAGPESAEVVIYADDEAGEEE